MLPIIIYLYKVSIMYSRFQEGNVISPKTEDSLPHK